MLEIILEIASTILFAWIFFKAIKLTFKITWGFAKIIAIILFIIALPALILCLLFAGSAAVLLLPLALVGAAFGLVKCCTS